MGKKRVIKKSGEDASFDSAKGGSLKSRIKKKIQQAILFVLSTYNNTILSLTDEKGNVVFQSSSGKVGFHGSKKGTPYAAAKAAQMVAERAEAMGVEDLSICVNGIGSGRESVIRFFAQRGFNINSIKDITPIPHGNPKPPKRRRV